jgi:hypothetical protein
MYILSFCILCPTAFVYGELPDILQNLGSTLVNKYSGAQSRILGCDGVLLDEQLPMFLTMQSIVNII